MPAHPSLRTLSLLLIAGSITLLVTPARATAQQIATTTTLTTSPATGVAGSPLKFTVTVMAGSTPVPSGQVAICTGADFGCNLAEAFTVLQLSSNGTASVDLIGVGSDTFIQAGFAGTKNYASSTSTLDQSFSFLNLNVPTTTTFVATGPPGNYTLSATVAFPSLSDAGQFPTGPLNFVDTSNGNHVIGVGGNAFLGAQNMDTLASFGLPAVGAQPNHIVAGDFNGDGLTDLAIVNTGDNTVSILISKGDGTFKPQVTYPTGHAPGAIITGDFNADGNLDLAILNVTDKTVSILRGTGTGTFLPQTTYATGNDPIALATGDLNEDGIADLVVLNHDDKTVGILLGHGDATFAPQVTYATGNDPRSIAVGDTNTDGHIDVLVANFADNTISMLLGAGDGTLAASTPMATGHGPIAVYLVDLDDSELTSLIFLNSTDNTMTILSRQFEQPAYVTTTYSTGVGPLAVIFQYFNSDRVPDPAVLSSDGTLDVYPASGNFDGLYGPTPFTYSAPIGASSLAFGDFNGDALADIAIAGGTTTPPALLLQQFTWFNYYQLTGVALPGISSSRVIASFGGDAGFLASSSTAMTLFDSPIVTVTNLAINPTHGVSPGQTDTLTATLTPTVDGSFTATGGITFMDGNAVVCAAAPIISGAATCTTGPLPIQQHIFRAVYAGDTFFAASSSATRSLNVSNPSTTSLSLSALTAPVGTPVMASIAVQDLHGPVNGGTVNLCESTAPFCTGSALLGTVQLQNANGTAPGTASVPLLLPAGKHNVQAVALGTVPDAMSASTSHLLTVFPTTATTTTLASSGSAGNDTLTATVTSSPDNAAATGTVVTFTDATNTFFSKTAALGASAFTSSFATPIGFIADGQEGVVKSIKLGSLRGNGVQDMIYPNYSDGELAVRLGQPSGTGTCKGLFGCQVEYALPSDAVFSCPGSVALADFNGDGKLDAVVGDECSGMIYIFLGNGDGTFPASPNFTYDVDSTVVIPFTEVGPFSITTGDLNQDGHPDIAIGTDEGSVYVLLNKGTGDGSMNPAVLYQGYQGDNYFTDITAVDLNGDGSLDLVYTQAFGGPVSVMLNNGDGTFQPEIQNDNTGGSGGAGNGLAAGDFNNDGVPDVVVTDGSEACIMLGNSDGTFQDGTCYSTGSVFAYEVAVGDFNGDGVQDVVISNGSDNGSIGIITGQSTTRNNPDGSITFLPTGTFNNFKKLNSFGGEDLYMTSGDINGDGVLDIVVHSQDDDKNYVLIGAAGFTATAKATGVSIPGSATASAHSIIATYPGDANHTASASAGLGVAGVPITTTTTLAFAPATNSAYGLTTTVTATVTPAIVTSYVSVSPVTFKDGSTTLSPTKPLASGLAAYPYVPAIGAHSFTAVYTADANFKTSTSGAMADTVVKATPTFGTMTFSPAASEQLATSQIITISDTLNFNGGTAPTTANVSYTLNGVNYPATTCTVVVANSETCTATVPAATIAGLGINPYSVSAAFIADTNYNAAIDFSGIFTISAVPPPVATVSAISSPFGSTAGIVVTATESGTSGPVTNGVVTFHTTGSATGSFSPTTCTLPVGGSCTTTYMPTGALVIGAYTNDIIASFSAVGSYAAANGTSTLTISPIAPSSAAVSAVTSTFGSTTGITITAAESGSGGAVTGGIVTFSATAGTFSPTTCTLTAAGNCTTTYTPSATLAVGTYPSALTASFAAVGNYAAASALSTLTVNQATQTINFTAPTSPVTYGVNPITLHATSGSSGISIIFTIDPSSNATGSITGSVLTVTSAGVFNINANQAGNANFTAAAQIQQSIVVSKAPLTVSANGASMPFGGPIPTLTGSLSGVIGSDGITATYSTNATVTSPVGSNYLVTPALVDPNNKLSNYSLQTGSIETAVFTITNTPLTVTAANVSRIYGAANPTLPVNVAGQKNIDAFTATASTTATSVSPVLAGGYVISPAVAAIAPASLSNYTVALVSGTLTITQAPTAVALVQTLPSTPGVGTGVSAAFTATVTDSGANSTGTPTGFVNFFDGATLLNPNPIALTNGVASIANIVFTTVAAHPITAVYLGDNNFTGNTSAALNEGVVTPSFSISTSPGSLTIARGSSATDTLTFTPVGDYQASLTLACSGLPSFATCQFLPPTITFTGNNAVQTSTLTVFTLNAHDVAGNSGSPAQSLLWLPAAGMLAMLIAIRRRKLIPMLRPLLMLAIAALAMTALTGCGSGASFATPAGVNVVTVTATANGAPGTSSPNTAQTATISITITQ